MSPPTPPPPPYDLASTITTIRSFYTFLTTLPRLSPSSIEDAPPRGWPSLTPSLLSLLGESDAVNELYRHLPRLNGYEESQIVYETRAIDYGGAREVKWAVERGVVEGNLEPIGAGVVPEYVSVLTRGGGEEGTIPDYIQQERPPHASPGLRSPDFWRAYKTLPIAEFFQDWKAKYLCLEWVVIPSNADDGVLLQVGKPVDVRDIYRAHGWPDDFDHEACREAVIKWDEARFTSD